MDLEMFYVPTTDLGASLELYRALGFTEVWREGENTAAVTLPDGKVQVMLDTSDGAAPAGLMLTVPSVTEFHASRPESLVPVEEPAAIPGGFWASYTEPGGGTLYVIDQSTDQP